MSSLLEVRGLTSGYGNRVVISSLNLQVESGELVALLGPNGSGKSTLVLSLVNLVHHFDGDVLFDGASVSRLETHRFVARGVALVPQSNNVFADMTVAENIRVARSAVRRERRSTAMEETVLGIFPELLARWRSRASSLSGGERQMLAVARALVTSPRLLLLDEPTRGLAPQAVEALMAVIRRTRDEMGVTSIIAEQNVEAAGSICTRYYLLKSGVLARSGPIGAQFREELASEYLV